MSKSALDTLKTTTTQAAMMGGARGLFKPASDALLQNVPDEVQGLSKEYIAPVVRILTPAVVTTVASLVANNAGEDSMVAKAVKGAQFAAHLAMLGEVSEASFQMSYTLGQKVVPSGLLEKLQDYHLAFQEKAAAEIAAKSPETVTEPCKKTI